VGVCVWALFYSLWKKREGVGSFGGLMRLGGATRFEVDLRDSGNELTALHVLLLGWTGRGLGHVEGNTYLVLK
jgi:hypothetical protein